MLFIRKIIAVGFIFVSLGFQPNQPLHTIPLTNLKNQSTTLAFSPQTKATVIYFLSPECPLCQSYTLTINQLAKTYQNKGIAFVGVVPGKDYSIASILHYKRNYQLSIPLLVDPQLKLTKTLGATITPKAFVISNQQKVLYKGRIDNWAYELGKKRKVITEHNLKDALEALLHHQAIKVTQTKAVGCFIE